jgi:hypothetical protein
MTSIEVPDWVVEIAARVVAKNVGEDYDGLGQFTQDTIKATQRECITAALGAWVVPVAWGVRYDWEGTGKSEVRDLRFTKDSAEGAAFAAQCSIPPGFPIKVSAQPLYTFRQEKPE